MTSGLQPARALAWGTGWNAAGSIGAAALNFLTTLMITRSLGVDGYARYSYLLWLAAIGALIGSVGLPRPLARFVAKSRGEGHQSESGPLVRRSCHLATAGGVAISVPLTLAAHHFDAKLAVGALLLLVATIVSGALASIQAAALQGHMSFRGLAVANVMTAGTLFVGSLVVALRGGTAQQQFAAAALASATLVCVQALLLARHAETGLRASDEGQSFQIPIGFRSYWRGAAGLMMIEAVVWQRPEVLFLATFAEPRQTGYYNAAWVIASRLAVLATLLAPVLLAQVAGMRYSDEADRMRLLYRSSSRWLCLLATPVFLLPAGLSGPLLGILFGQTFEPAGPTMSVLMVGALASTVSVAGSAVVYGTDRIGFALRWGAIAAATTLSLNALLTPTFGAPGAAVASVGGQAVAIGATLALSLAPSGFRFPWPVFARTMAAGLLAALIARLLHSWLGGFAGIALATAVGALVYSGGVLVSGMLRAEDWALVQLIAPGFSRRSRRLHALLTRALGPDPGGQ